MDRYRTGPEQTGDKRQRKLPAGSSNRSVRWFSRDRERVFGAEPPLNPFTSIAQSLCHFLQTQLTAYYHLVSILETQMTSGSAETSEEPSSSSSAAETMAEGSGLTLMRLGVWTREVRLKMRLMSLMVEDCRSESRSLLSSLTDETKLTWLSDLSCLPDSMPRWRPRLSHPLVYGERGPVRSRLH